MPGEGWKKRPVWGGLVVPYVALWSGERLVEETYHIVPKLFENSPWWPEIEYTNPNLNHRDVHGILWQRENPGYVGRPEFGAVSTTRQRRSMRTGLCQICGYKIEDTKYWLVSKPEIFPRDGEPFVTATPPVCSDCVAVAEELCPHLKKAGFVQIAAEQYKEWGVFGEFVQLVPQENVLKAERRQGNVKLGRAQIRSTLAKQLVIEILDYTVVDNKER